MQKEGRKLEKAERTPGERSPSKRWKISRKRRVSKQEGESRKVSSLGAFVLLVQLF